ncbi:LamG-like jellyroll fold domain-containing protein [Rubritalea tangerina]
MSVSAALVAHYTMDDGGNLGANSGSATINWNSQSGATGISPGKLGNAGAFVAGSSSFWSNQFASANTDVSNFSLSMHVRTTTTANWDDFVSIGIGNNSFVLEKNGSNGVSLFNIGNVGGVASGGIASSIIVNDGAWHHIGMVSNGSTIELFMDGVSQGSVAYTGTGTLSSFQLASRFGDGARAITTDIDDVAVYDTALSAGQMQWLSSNVATTTPVPEPSSSLLIALSALGLTLRRKRA